MSPINWQLPWVSRRAYDLVVAQLERVMIERDEYRARGDRLYDETIIRFGYEPAAPRVRAENAAAVEEYERASVIEDPLGGGLDEEIEAAVDEVVAEQQKSSPN